MEKNAVFPYHRVSLTLIFVYSHLLMSGKNGQPRSRRPCFYMHNKKWLAELLRMYQHVPLEFGKDACSKLAPIPRLPLFLVHQSVHYPEV